MKRCSLRSLLTSSLLLLAFSTSHATAQEESEQGDVEELKKQVEAQNQAKKKDPSQGKLVKVFGPFRGKADAPLTLIEFSDYQ